MLRVFVTAPPPRLWWCALLLCAAIAIASTPTAALRAHDDSADTLPHACGHEQIMAAQGDLPNTFVTLRRRTDGVPYRATVQLKTPNATATAAQRAVEPQATVTVTPLSTDAEWAPIRIAVFMPDLEDPSRYCTALGQMRPDSGGSLVECTSTDDILTEAKRTTLMNFVVPEAVNMHAQRLLVRPLDPDTSIVVNSMPGSYCGSFTVPAAHRTTGVPNADFVVYVAAGPTSTPRSFIAWAVTCQLYPNTPTITSRPAVGAIYFNPRYLPSQIGETPDEILNFGGNPSGSSNGLRRAAAHELLHALGFTSGVFRARGMFATVPSLRGKTNVPVLNSSAVRAAAKAKYGIADGDAFFGAELEDVGGGGTALSHWKRRTMRDELMAPVLSLARYSSLSLAAMEDMGFYKANFDKAEPVDLGATAGAKLFTDPCLADGASNFPAVFCDSLSSAARMCTTDRLNMGRCGVTFYSSDLPTFAQYYPQRPTLGGSISYSDYCPAVQPFSNTGCNAGSVASMPGSVVGDDARCFTSLNLVVKRTFTDPGAICAKVHCENATRTYKVLVSGGTSWLSCGAGGPGVVVQPATSSPDVFAAGGSIGCPPYDDVCYANPLAFEAIDESALTTTTTTTATPSAAHQHHRGRAASGVVVAIAVVLSLCVF
ncbi:leishmanolysin, GP63 [Novymonas esmeraldas]|uniref:Leishmanolysin-like peptidase n=1 Tax=Novymonas esmeraldas TaxID=1808958 RepID=A0AAW0EZ16_9TRYP